ncbi:putative ficolin-2-like [Apostichopus japonicus]|uniref:Putative ficolin-2-like n=1 Tax=Stichopus japonicus TaxID=307972 RepID=A0A2G8KYJ1_STIJA|nr:putative ficolin-2-like [Apostichopus japonicus]
MGGTNASIYIDMSVHREDQCDQTLCRTKNYTLYLYQFARDCEDAVYCGTSRLSGDYLIQPDGYDDQPFNAYCDSSQNNGTAWTLIQRREYKEDLDSTVTFNRSWEDYRLGFGLSPNDFWIGNEKLSYLTNQNTYQLRIDMTTSNGSSIHVTYDNFRISDEFSGYKLLSTGGSYVYPNCSLNCSCVDGNVTCVSYTCSVNATCNATRNNAGQCYCKTGYVGDGTVCRYPKDCLEIFEHDDRAESRVYTIQPNKNSESTLEVFCNMSDGGGWTVFQRRFDGSQNFALPEQNYSEGFGSLLGEFWLGNENLHTLTNQMQYELKIDFMDKNNTLYEAEYSSFQISNKTEKYALQLGDFIKGNAGDSLTNYSNRQPFLTDLTAAWQAVTVKQRSDSVTTVHTPTQYDYSVQHDEGNGQWANTDDEPVQEFTEFLKPISVGPWWHCQDETMTIECDLNGNYSNMFWFTIPQRIASTGMKIRPTRK